MTGICLVAWVRLKPLSQTVMTSYLFSFLFASKFPQKKTNIFSNLQPYFPSAVLHIHILLSHLYASFCFITRSAISSTVFSLYLQDGQSRTVRQFQFTDWPEQGVPKSGEGFIDFIGQVHKTKEQFGQDGPISVHCR